MAIANWYFDSAAAGSGTGTQLDPWKTLAAGASSMLGSGNTNRCHLKAGSVFYETVPFQFVAFGTSLEVDTYGGSAPATIDATTEVLSTSWTYDNTNDLYTATVGTNVSTDIASRFTIGGLFEDGEILPMQVYNSNLTTLRSTLEGGGYAYNWLTGVVYWVPTSPGAHLTRAATRSYVVDAGANGTYSISTINNAHKMNRRWENIIFIGGKRHGYLAGGTKGIFENCGFYGHGGQQIATSGSTHLGNGLEIGLNSPNVWTVKNCWFDQIFDSGVTVQIVDNDAVAQNVIIEDSTFNACGYYAVEHNLQGGNAGSTITDIVTRRCTITGGESFAPAIHTNRFNGIVIVRNGTGTLKDLLIEDNYASGLQGNAISLNFCTSTMMVRNNTLEDSGLGIFFGTGAGSGTMQLHDNILNGCGIRLNHSTTGITTNATGNIVNNTNGYAFQDGSNVNTPLVINDNTFNGSTFALDVNGTRTTTNVTGSGNTSTSGTIESGWEVFF